MSARAPAVPASPLQRAARATGSLLLLAGLVGGLPVALAVLAGNPLPSQLPGTDRIWSALISRDDGSLLLSLIAVAGWLAWAGFTGSVLLELFARLTHRPTPAIPGLAGPQRFASLLIAAIAALTVTPTLTSASAAVVDSPPPAVAMAVADPAGEPRPGGKLTRNTSAQIVHTVARGEGLLDLQERYGVRWQRIAEVNYGVPQPDGRSLQRGQTRIYPGWQLLILPGQAGGAAAAGSMSAADIDPASVDLAAADPATVDPAAVDPVAASADEGVAHQYEVAKHDWLWHISDRYLGDPQRYPEIAALNPEFAERHGEFPDHIEPGWMLRLPADAVDRGPAHHATGTVAPVETEPGAAGDDRPPEVAGFGAAAPPPGTAGSGLGASPAPPQPADPSAQDRPEPADGVPPGGPDPGEPADPADRAVAEPEPEPEPDESALERFAPATLAGAGLLTALALGAAALVRRRRHQHHRPGYRFASPAAARLEKLLHAAQQPLDASRLDAALRQLASALSDRADAGQLPDIAGALVDDGAVHLLLANPCPAPPAPWRDHGDRWSLPAGVPVPAPTGRAGLAAVPTLTAIGSQAGIHLLLDLERQGFLTIHGDPSRAMDLLRYLAAELACHSWSDPAEVLLAGFPPDEVELLVAVNPDRVRAAPSVAGAAALLRHRISSARSTLRHTGAPDAFAGRVGGVAGDAWMPQVLLVAAGPGDEPALAELERELGTGAPCAVAVATTVAEPAGPADATPGHRRVTVTPEGVVHVRLPYLHASLTAAGLTTDELAQLAGVMRSARTARALPVPPAPEPEPWALGTDAAGAVRAVGRARVGDPPPAGPPARLVPASPAMLTTDNDARLDDDLRAWHAADGDRPRIAILGTVSVAGSGPPPQTRRRLHTELVVFLAQRAGRGADDRQIASALWPDGRVTGTGRQLLISTVRRWLGSRPGGGSWLPDVDAELGYRLAEGYLLDWHLFRRLRTRADLRGAAGVEDLREALRLVRGVPLAGADQPAAPGVRNPYPWLAGSPIDPGHLVASIVDTAHAFAERCLAGGDPAGARWAAGQAWLADPGRGYDQPWQDLLRAEQADGHTEAVRAVLAELMEAREAETPADLSPETYRLVSAWPPHVLVPSG